MFRKFYFLIFLSKPAFCFTQQSDSLYQKSFADIYDNDFFSATDYYYTQGVRFEFVFPFVKKIPTTKLLFHFKKNTNEKYGFAFNQECFTPTSIRRDTVFTGDRPFAGAIYLSFFRVSNNFEKQRRIISEIDLGGVGPCASCRETQENIHKWLKNIQPLGWQYQVGNDLVLNYFLKYEKNIMYTKWYDMIGFADTKAGTLYDNLGIGFLMRAGLKENYFSVTDFSKKVQFYLFAKGDMHVIGYSATMQGGVFRKDNIYTISPKDIERFVFCGYGGIVLSYKKLSLEYTKVFLSPEYKNGLPHRWGHCNISVYF